jgi:putative ABC transport system ATP-binding protein
MPIIETKNLTKSYLGEGTETQALRGVSFSIEKGQFVAIMGPSGSGKSTLLHILGFLDSYTSGAYLFEGKEAHLYTPDEIAKIRNSRLGFVFQAFNLLPRTSVLENVKLPLLYSDVPESEWNDRALKAIESVGMMHRINHEPAQLSGGEKQRAAIARALIMEPSVIFADEPTGNLDPRSGQMVMETIQELNEKLGHTVVLITHETSTAQHAERIIHIRDGQIERDEKVSNRVYAKTFKK